MRVTYYYYGSVIQEPRLAGHIEIIGDTQCVQGFVRSFLWSSNLKIRKGGWEIPPLCFFGRLHIISGYRADGIGSKVMSCSGAWCLLLLPEAQSNQLIRVPRSGVARIRPLIEMWASTLRRSLLSSGMWHSVDWKIVVDVSVAHIASVFRL
jgi:hypothetical protein